MAFKSRWGLLHSIWSPPEQHALDGRGMLASKTFVKKTKKGAVVKVVREHYLRDDVWCGVNDCMLCKQQQPVLERCPAAVSDLCQYPHLLLPDTNVVLHQTDFVEDAVITNAVILQTVLQEVSIGFPDMILIHVSPFPRSNTRISAPTNV